MATSVNLNIYEDINTSLTGQNAWCEYTPLIRGEIISGIAEQLTANNSAKGVGKTVCKWTLGM